MWPLRPGPDGLAVLRRPVTRLEVGILAVWLLAVTRLVAGLAVARLAEVGLAGGSLRVTERRRGWGARWRRGWLGWLWWGWPELIRRIGVGTVFATVRASLHHGDNLPGILVTDFRQIARTRAELGVCPKP